MAEFIYQMEQPLSSLLFQRFYGVSRDTKVCHDRLRSGLVSSPCHPPASLFAINHDNSVQMNKQSPTLRTTPAHARPRFLASEFAISRQHPKAETITLIRRPSSDQPMPELRRFKLCLGQELSLVLRQ